MNDEGNRAAIRAGRCPDCGYTAMVCGPWGGLSRNIYCPQCLVCWNVHGVKYGAPMVERGDPITPQMVEWAKRVYGDERWSGC